MKNVIEDLLFKNECYKIAGLCIRVHSLLGRGFREVVYQDALEIELKDSGIPYQREKPFLIEYRDMILPHHFRADFFVYGSIILELKAHGEFFPDNFRQVLNYLKAGQVQLGILINFGGNQLQFKRIIHTKK